MALRGAGPQRQRGPGAGRRHSHGGLLGRQCGAAAAGPAGGGGGPCDDRHPRRLAAAGPARRRAARPRLGRHAAGHRPPRLPRPAPGGGAAAGVAAAVRGGMCAGWLRLHGLQVASGHRAPADWSPRAANSCLLSLFVSAGARRNTAPPQRDPPTAPSTRAAPSAPATWWAPARSPARATRVRLLPALPDLLGGAWACDSGLEAAAPPALAGENSERELPVHPPQAARSSMPPAWTIPAPTSRQAMWLLCPLHASPLRG